MAGDLRLPRPPAPAPAAERLPASSGSRALIDSLKSDARPGAEGVRSGARTGSNTGAKVDGRGRRPAERSKGKVEEPTKV